MSCRSHVKADNVLICFHHRHFKPPVVQTLSAEEPVVLKFTADKALVVDNPEIQICYLVELCKFSSLCAFDNMIYIAVGLNV